MRGHTKCNGRTKGGESCLKTGPARPIETRPCRPEIGPARWGPLSLVRSPKTRPGTALYRFDVMSCRGYTWARPHSLSCLVGYSPICGRCVVFKQCLNSSITTLGCADLRWDSRRRDKCLIISWSWCCRRMLCTINQHNTDYIILYKIML